MPGRAALLALAACLTLTVDALAAVWAPPTTPAPRVERVRVAPIRFEPNQGQTDPAVRYLSRGSGLHLVPHVG